MSMKSAVEDAVMTANQGKVSHTLASGPVWGNDDAEMRSKISWSLLRSGAEGAYVYWMVLDDTTAPEIAARKLRVSKKGDGSTLMKESEIEAAGVTHVLLGVLTSGRSAGSEAGNVKAAGLKATLTVVPANPIAAIKIKMAGGAQVLKPVEETVAMTDATWVRWGGCSAEQAFVPVHADLPTVAVAGAVVATSAGIAGASGSFEAAILATLGITPAGSDTNVAEIAALVAHWAGCPERSDALAVVLGVTSRAAAFASTVGTAGDAVIAELRKELRQVQPASINLVAGKQAALLAATGLTSNAAMIGEWLHSAPAPANFLPHPGTAAPAHTGAPTGAPATAPAVNSNAAGQFAICLAEADRQVATGGDAQQRAAMVAALAQWLMGTGFGAAAPQAETNPGEPEGAPRFAELRPVGAAALSNGQVLIELAGAMQDSVTVAAVCDALAVAAGAAPPCTLFAPTNAVSARNTAAHFEALRVRAGLTFEGAAASWDDAAGRLEEVMTRLRQGAPPPATTTGTGDDSKAVEDSGEAGTVKLNFAGKDGKGAPAVGRVLGALTTAGFVRSESVAAKGAGPLAEMHRLNHLAGDVGVACRALNNSDGSFSQSMQNKGRVGASAVDGREGVVAYLEMRMQDNMGDLLYGEADTEVSTLASQIVSSRPNFDLSTKILGSEKPQRSSTAGRVVITPGRFGTTKGARGKANLASPGCSMRRARHTTNPSPHTRHCTSLTRWRGGRATSRGSTGSTRGAATCSHQPQHWSGGRWEGVGGEWGGKGVQSDTYIFHISDTHANPPPPYHPTTDTLPKVEWMAGPRCVVHMAAAWSSAETTPRLGACVGGMRGRGGGGAKRYSKQMTGAPTAAPSARVHRIKQTQPPTQRMSWAGRGAKRVRGRHGGSRKLAACDHTVNPRRQ